MDKPERPTRLPKLRNCFRLSLLSMQLMDSVAAKMAVDRTGVVEAAVRVYARQVLGDRRYREIERGVEVFGPEMYEEVVEERRARYE